MKYFITYDLVTFRIDGRQSTNSGLEVPATGRGRIEVDQKIYDDIFSDTELLYFYRNDTIETENVDPIVILDF